jgi:hypothetical protein
MWTFKAEIKMIGINPYVSVPDKALKGVLKQAGKDKGQIPIRGTVNDNPYRQTLVKYSGEWRLYINTTMLKNSPKRVGEIIHVSIEFDDADRTIQPHSKFTDALNNNPDAQQVFDTLPPSRQKEIVRYIAALKTEESVDKNVHRAIQFLQGTGRFVGRDKP